MSIWTDMALDAMDGCPTSATRGAAEVWRRHPDWPVELSSLGAARCIAHRTPIRAVDGRLPVGSDARRWPRLSVLLAEVWKAEPKRRT